jgi:hypothetical protein
MKICLRKLFVNLLLLVSTSCLADTWISIGGGTDHFCHTCGYNNFNPGLGIQHDYDKDVKLIAGGYYNSFRKVSFYGGAAYQPLQYGVFKFGLIGAVVSNYNNLRIPVMALPVVSVEGERVGVDILGGPSVGSYHGLITANLKFKL